MQRSIVVCTTFHSSTTEAPMSSITTTVDPHRRLAGRRRPLVDRLRREALGRVDASAARSRPSPARSTTERGTLTAVDGSVEVGSLVVADPNLDGHLRSDDFFAVEQFPAATFRSTAIAEHGRRDLAHGRADDPRHHAADDLHRARRGRRGRRLGPHPHRPRVRGLDRPHRVRGRLERPGRERGLRRRDRGRAHPPRRGDAPGRRGA